MRKINMVVIHCTATKEGQDFTAKDIDMWHKERGWKGIGYHYVVRLNGGIDIGRDQEEIGAHAKGYNRNSIGIVYVGGIGSDGKDKDTRTKEQKESLMGLVEIIKLKHGNVKVLGHRDLPNVTKSCPCFDAKKMMD